VEAVIALSVVTLGAVVALGLRFPVAAGMAMIGGFAIFHGYAHGAEMPAGAGAAPYAAGFVGATILLHLAGLAAGLAVARTEVRVLRAAGAAIAVAGAVLLSTTI
jgi:urease accessory protein